MGTLVIHAGVQKTATTYVQNRFRLNRDMLRQHGIIYPRLRWDYDHQALTTAWLNTKFPASFYFPYGPAGYFDRVVGRYVGREETVFLSSEAIYGLWSDPKKLRDVRHRLRGFDEVRLILVVRSQIDLIQSMWMEVCKLRTKCLDPTRFVDRALGTATAIGNTIRFEPIYRGLTEAFGAENVTVASYPEVVSAPGGPFGFFLRNLGVDAAASHFDDVPETASNISPDPLASAVFRKVFPNDTLDAGFVSRLSKVVNPASKKRTTLFTHAQAAQALETFDPLNRAFQEAVARQQPAFRFAVDPIVPEAVHLDDLTVAQWEKVAALAAGRTKDGAMTKRLRAFSRRLPPAIVRGGVAASAALNRWRNPGQAARGKSPPGSVDTGPKV